MRILYWQQLDPAQRRAALARPAVAGRADVAADVARLISQVRAEGDLALLELTWRFDGVRLEGLAVSAAEFAAARSKLTPVQICALERAVANIESFHAAQQLPPLSVETTPGVRCERITRAIGAVGLYVPAGSAPLPSA
ncbi:MAG: histidinol dehydrogenase, partial [Steroidobacteraceae bacterium]